MTERKKRPVFTGLRAYFPDALMAVAHVSWLGNEQHNPGEPLHWARGKSADQLDAADRHLTDHAKGEIFDDDGGRHLAKAAWRILAQLQLDIEADNKLESQIERDIAQWQLANLAGVRPGTVIRTNGHPKDFQGVDIDDLAISD